MSGKNSAEGTLFHIFSPIVYVACEKLLPLGRGLSRGAFIVSGAIVLAGAI